MTNHPIAFHTFLLSLLHLLVDGVCACGVTMSCQTISVAEACGVIVLYDVLAFGTQPLTGRWVDASSASGRRLKLATALLVGGALTCVLPVSLNLLTATIGAILLGMGNSLFHVYGGKYVAVVSHHDIRVMGIFVSTGAVGLALGIGFSSPILLAAFLLALLSLSALHLYYARRVLQESPLHVYTEEAEQSAAVQEKLQSPAAVPLLYLSCLMLVVAGRAFIGENVPSLRTSFHSTDAALTMVIVSVIVMAGKAAGGFLSKTWGVRNVFCVSLLLSAATFLMCPWHDAFVLATLLCVNISMPCTLYLATKAVPGREGWAFGLLAMALLPGFLLGQLTKHDSTCQVLLVPLMATILLESLLLLYMRERRWRVLATSVVLNIFTNVPLNAFIMAYMVTSPLCLVGLECIVVVVEFIGYWLVLHERRRAFMYSLLCNSFSALIGCLFQCLLTLFEISCGL